MLCSKIIVATLNLRNEATAIGKILPESEGVGTVELYMENEIFITNNVSLTY